LKKILGKIFCPFLVFLSSGFFRVLLASIALGKGALLATWLHAGFNVFCGNRIAPKDETAMGNLGRYVIQASFSQERMRYLEQNGTVVYRSKDGRSSGISSRIWGSGWSDQGRRQKSMPPHYPNPKPLIPTRIHHIHKPMPTPIPNTLG